MGEIRTDENFGDKAGDDRLREHCTYKGSCLSQGGQFTSILLS